MARVRRSRRIRSEVSLEAAEASPGIAPLPSAEAEGDPVCALCLRPIPRGVPQSLHHLVPKLKGGTHGPTVLLHHLCHKEIHAALSEAELARDFATPERLRAHPRLARFAAWVGRRPPSFLSRVPRPGRR